MRITSRTTTTVAAVIIALATFPMLETTASAGITFLHHFNSSTSFDIAPANGDYAGGDSTATTSNSPATDVGFFPSSTPANLAFKAGSTSPSYVEFNGADGNIDYTSPTTGGITVGAWIKFTGAANPVGRVLTLGAPDLDDDYLFVDYGNSNTDILRASFRDGSNIAPVTSPSAVNLSDWVYLAVSVDLTHSLMTLYFYDDTGTAIGGSGASTAISVGNWNLDNPLAVGHRVRIGGLAAPGSALWMDELSIDDEALSESTISARVASMVAGNQLAVPEPLTTGSSLLLLGALATFRRCRRSAAV